MTISDWATGLSSFRALAGDTFTSNNRNVQMVKIGVNYLFGGPTATRY
jgi:hypothetical protein